MQAAMYVIGEPCGIGVRQTILVAQSGITIMRKIADRASITGFARCLCQFRRTDGYLSRGSIFLQCRTYPSGCVSLKADPLDDSTYTLAWVTNASGG